MWWPVPPALTRSKFDLNENLASPLSPNGRHFHGALLLTHCAKPIEWIGDPVCGVDLDILKYVMGPHTVNRACKYKSR
jgi:hypothetical protein